MERSEANFLIPILPWSLRAAFKAAREKPDKFRGTQASLAKGRKVAMAKTKQRFGILRKLKEMGL